MEMSHSVYDALQNQQVCTFYGFLCIASCCKITYCAEVTSGYLGTGTGEILFVQSRLLNLYQLHGQSLFLAETKLIKTLINTLKHVNILIS